MRVPLANPRFLELPSRSPGLASFSSVAALLAAAMLARLPTASASSIGAGQVVSCPDARTQQPFEIRAQRVLISGVIDTTWVPDSTRVCAGPVQERFQAAVSDLAGGMFVAWVESRELESDIYAQRLTAADTAYAGWPLGGIPVCSAPRSQYGVSIASDGSGGALLAWIDFRQVPGSRVYVQRISGTGSPAVGWPEGGLAVGSDSALQSEPVIAADGMGGAFAIWLEHSVRQTLVRLARVTSAGRADAAWPTGGLGIGADPASDAGLRLVEDGQGGVIAGWAEGSRSAGGRVRLLRIEPSGSIAAGWTSSGLALGEGAGARHLEALAGGAAGGAIALWRAEDAGQSTLHLGRVGSDGQVDASWPAGGATPVSSSGSQFDPVLRSDGRGGVLLAWQDFRSGQDFDIYAQRVDSTGHVSPGWPDSGLVVCAEAGDQLSPSVALDSTGVVITWIEPQSSGTEAFMSAARLLQRSAPRLKSVEAYPGRALLTWIVPAGSANGLTFQAYRSGPDGDWKALTALRADRSGQLSLADRTAPPGTTQRYPLSIQTEGGEVFLPEVAVKIPLPKPLALVGVHLLPSRHGIGVSFTLASDAAAEVSVFDVAGRRLARRDLTEFGSGDHQAEVQISSGVPAGVYFVRLSQGGVSRVRRYSLYK